MRTLFCGNAEDLRQSEEEILGNLLVVLDEGHEQYEKEKQWLKFDNEEMFQEYLQLSAKE